MFRTAQKPLSLWFKRFLQAWRMSPMAGHSAPITSEPIVVNPFKEGERCDDENQEKHNVVPVGLVAVFVC
jgi:hypothetical protein